MMFLPTRSPIMESLYSNCSAKRKMLCFKISFVNAIIQTESLERQCFDWKSYPAKDKKGKVRNRYLFRTFPFIWHRLSNFSFCLKCSLLKYYNNLPM